MQPNDVIAAVGRLPREFKRRQNVSMLALLKESGYLGSQSDVTIAALQAHFASHAEDLEAWVSSSYDNRSSPAWYVAEPSGSGSRWEVGHQPGGQREHFESGAAACAVYVKRWLESASSITEHAP